MPVLSPTPLAAQRVVRMVAGVRPEYDTGWSATKAVAAKLGIGTTETLCKCDCQDQTNRQGHEVARCTIERLMRELGLAGAVRVKKVITTVSDPAASRARDLVDRDFLAQAPTAAGSRTSPTSPPGPVSSTSRSSLTPSPAASSAGPQPRPTHTELVLTALEMGFWERDREGSPHQPGQLIHHSDSEYVKYRMSRARRRMPHTVGGAR